MENINFILTKKDYWNYNSFSVLNVKNIRKIFLTTPVLVFTLTILAGLVFKLDMKVILAVAIGLPAFYLLTIFLPMAYGIMKIPKEKLVEQKIEFDEDKKQIIQYFGTTKHTKYNKTNVMQVKKTKNYVFITMHTFSAIIIPKNDNYDLDKVFNTVQDILK